MRIRILDPRGGRRAPWCSTAEAVTPALAVILHIVLAIDADLAVQVSADVSLVLLLVVIAVTRPERPAESIVIGG